MNENDKLAWVAVMLIATPLIIVGIWLCGYFGGCERVTL